MWVASEPFLPLPLDADASAVGDAVLSALTASSDAISHPTDWRAMAMPRLAAAGVRSERSFQLGTALVTVTRSKSGYWLEPHHNGGTSGDSKGFHPMPELGHSISLSCNIQSLGAAVLDAFGSSGPRPNNSFKPKPLRGSA